MKMLALRVASASRGAATAACRALAGAPDVASSWAPAFDAGRPRSLSMSCPEDEIGFIAKSSATPEESVAGRKATIYTPSRTAGQQGMGNTSFLGAKGKWRLAFETEAKWENPLMGWTSTADAYENVFRMMPGFDTKDDAIAYCKKQGWDYVVQEPNLPDKRRAKRFNSYGDNFSHLRSGIPEGGLKSEVLGDVPVVGAAKPAKKTKAKKKT